jgi:hypothetical protein
LRASQFVTVDFEGVAVTGFSSRDGGRKRGIGFNTEATEGAEFTETKEEARYEELPGLHGNTPRGVSDVWQTLGLETPVFGSVAILGLTGEFSDVWQGKELEKRK